MACVHRILSILVIAAAVSQYVEPTDTKEYSMKHGQSEMSYRLPDSLYPECYRLEILINLGDLNKNFTFVGTVSIEVTCKAATNKIILHAKNLNIDEEKVVVQEDIISCPEEAPHDKSAAGRRNCKRQPGRQLQITEHCYHDDYELYIISLSEDLKPGSSYTICIPYSAELTQSLAGCYRSQYKDMATGETRWLAVTQFESTDARAAFPCFDEPAFKARFQLNLGHINTRTSISNMPIVNTVPIEGMEGWVWDQYEETVPMSTYLLAFVVSDFSCKVAPKTSTSDIVFRVWARNDAINQVDYATALGPQILEYFEQYFDVKYPLPKMDMIAIPDFSSGAMENWGLITYREVALLYDPAVSTVSSKPFVASIIAHELAHQWFGNLVTMKWWTDLWLNEGFATYVSALGVNFMHPEWNYLEEEVVDNMMSVFDLDSLKSSHPISVPIGHPREIPQIFDAISYKKGCFLLRMMNLFLGEETFRKGVSNYLKAHAYANAEQDDLWVCLTEEAHKNQVLPPYMTVKRIMDSWTLQTGYPLITVERDYYTGEVMIRQERFLTDRQSLQEESNARWWVPLSYTTEAEGNFNDTRPKEWLSPKQNSIVVEGFPNSGWLIFNLKISGLYRVKYDTKNWKMLIATLEFDHRRIDILNRVQLIEDSLELAKTGDIDYKIPFNILQYLQKECEYLPWKTALRNLGFLGKMLRFYPSYGYFREFMKSLLACIYDCVEKDKSTDDSENLSKIKHQTLIAAWACKFEVGDCKDKAVASFQAWMNSQNPDSDIPIQRDSRPHVFCTAVRYGGEREWNFLWERYLMSNVGNERNIILSALGCTREIWILNRYLEWSIDESSGIRKQDSTSVFVGIARGDVGYFLAKSFLQRKLAKIYHFHGPNSIRLGSYFSVLATQVTSEFELMELEDFTFQNEKYFRQSQKAVKQALENAKINIQWQQKFYNQVSELLSASVGNRPPGSTDFKGRKINCGE